MTWHLLMKTLTVKDGERALLTRDGRFERVLEPGRHRLFDLRGQLTAEIFNVVRNEFPAERYAVLKAARPDLAADCSRRWRRRRTRSPSSASTAALCT